MMPKSPSEGKPKQFPDILKVKPAVQLDFNFTPPVKFHNILSVKERVFHVELRAGRRKTGATAGPALPGHLSPPRAT
jgi:hypothetical protein